MISVAVDALYDYSFCVTGLLDLIEGKESRMERIFKVQCFYLSITILIGVNVLVLYSVDSNSILKPVVSVIDLEHIFTTDIGVYDVVVLPSFVPSMDSYEHILTKMARQSVNGVLHSYLTKGDTELAGPLIKVLEQCGQEVPQTLQDLHRTSNTRED